MEGNDRLVHIVGWADYLRYVRGEKITSSDWRPLKVDFSVANTKARIYDLTLVQRGAFLTLVCEYADCPLLDPGDPKGPRRLPLGRAQASLRDAGANAQRIIERLEQAGCVALGPS